MRLKQPQEIHPMHAQEVFSERCTMRLPEGILHPCKGGSLIY
jgi:hypothetical protein